MFKWGVFVGRRPGRVLGACLIVVLVCAGYGFGVFGSLSDGGFEDPDSESSEVQELLDTQFGDQTPDVTLIYADDELVVDSPEFRSAVVEVTDQLVNAGAQRVVSYYDTADPTLVGEDGHATRVFVTLPAEGERLDTFEELKPLFEAEGLTTYVAGGYALFSDANDAVEHDIVQAEAISIPLVFLLSLLVFGSFVAALMPTLVGVVAVIGAFTVVRLITEVTDVSVFAINVITLMGMGLAIDYALFVVARFREELGRERPDQSSGKVDREAVAAALGRTLATAGRTVFFSGVIVAASLSSLLLFPQVYLKSMGYGGMAAVLVAMAAALTVLPAVLAALGHRLEWGRIRRAAGKRRRGKRSAAPARWARIGNWVMRRPILTVLGVVALMFTLASPVINAKWGGVDERVLPSSSPSRKAAEANARYFGGEFSSAEVTVTDPAAVDDLMTALTEVDNVTATQVIGQSAGDRPVTLIQVTWPGRSQVPSSQEVVEDLRQAAAPFDALVGGQTATTVDLIDSIRETLPKMAGLVAVVMFVLLFIAFGSVVLPLKAIVMNAVSITASFGAVTWIFSDGHLSDLLGFTPLGYLDATQPILMLAVLFGLSMDYEVFLLSRVREEWDRTQDNPASVIAGLQKTGWLITSAALLLSVVIGGFATSGIVFLKMIGVGMLVAVLLDATVVRAMLVPATMRLLGRANWWAPGPLVRWWERYGHREVSFEVSHAPLSSTGSHRGSPAPDPDSAPTLSATATHRAPGTHR